MVSATFDPSWTDPFGKPPVAATDPATDAAQAEAAATAAAAAEAGNLRILLGSVMIGPKNRVATINGEACHEGDTIEVVDASDKAITYKLHVVRIYRQGVELAIGGRTITLELTQPRLAPGDDIEPGTPKGSH